MKTINHPALVNEYIQRNKIDFTADDIDNVYITLSEYYTLIEDGRVSKTQILLLKLETTNGVFKVLDIVPSFSNRCLFAKTFFVYEPLQELIDYIDWLENSYIEDNKWVIQKVHQDAAQKETTILYDLKIVDRNIGIKYDNNLNPTKKGVNKYEQNF